MASLRLVVKPVRVFGCNVPFHSALNTSLSPVTLLQKVVWRQTLRNFNLSKCVPAIKVGWFSYAYDYRHFADNNLLVSLNKSLNELNCGVVLGAIFPRVTFLDVSGFNSSVFFQHVYYKMCLHLPKTIAHRLFWSIKWAEIQLYVCDYRMPTLWTIINAGSISYLIPASLMHYWVHAYLMILSIPTTTV